jgi:hypothetical protein
MPAVKPNVGTGNRRQGDTDPDRSDDSRRARDRAIDRESDMAGREHEKGWDQGAHGGDEDGPLRRAGPGTQRDLEEADVDPDQGG